MHCTLIPAATCEESSHRQRKFWDAAGICACGGSGRRCRCPCSHTEPFYWKTWSGMLNPCNCKQPRKRSGSRKTSPCLSYIQSHFFSVATSLRSLVVKVIPGRGYSGPWEKMGGQRLCPWFLQWRKSVNSVLSKGLWAVRALAGFLGSSSVRVFKERSFYNGKNTC